MTIVDICGVGNALVDQQYTVSESVIRDLGYTLDQMTLAERDEQQQAIDRLNAEKNAFISACGGSATNTLVAASMLGSNCFQLCKVSTDVEGQLYIKSLSESGVQTCSPATQPNLPTGRCLVMVTPDCNRTMVTSLGISAHYKADASAFSTLEQSRSLYCEGYMVTSDDNFNSALSLVQQARSLGIKTILSLSDPGIVSFFRDQFTTLCEQPFDFIFCNDAEAMAFSEASSLDSAIDPLKAVAKQFAITKGSDGVLVFDGDSVIEVPGHAVTAVDTNGAGDMFAGAFLHGYLNGDSVVSCAQFANYCAAQLVMHFGPRLDLEAYKRLPLNYTLSK